MYLFSKNKFFIKYFLFIINYYRMESGNCSLKNILNQGREYDEK